MKSLAVALVLAACGGPGATSDAATGDATADSPVPMHVDDGAPTRQQCTSTFGNVLHLNEFGRMDGFLVAIVPPGGGGCNADSSHVHLQVRMNGAVYDVAVDIGGNMGIDDVHTTTRDVAMPGPPWSEGFHAGIPTDYIAMAGVHSADLPLETSHQALAAELASELANVNHISVYAIGYGPDGAHLVHRNGSGRDGLLATQPLSYPPHLRLFSFTSLTF